MRLSKVTEVVMLTAERHYDEQGEGSEGDVDCVVKVVQDFEKRVKVRTPTFDWHS